MLCAETYFPKVKQEHSFYQAFESASKITDDHPVILTQESPKVEFKGESEVQFGWNGFDCQFIATRSPKSRMKYGLKIRADYFGEKPCFRFCSRGAPHMNEETGQGLAARLIPTPHFHRIDNRGILYAYQKPPLVDPVESSKIINDPQLGTNLFCQETNLFSPNGSFVVVKIIATELDLSTGDPLDGATFPPP